MAGFFPAIRLLKAQTPPQKRGWPGQQASEATPFSNGYARP
ncbi:MAG: hypothetical protein WBA48_18610 [Xanthobacteraceae bacterium]